MTEQFERLSAILASRYRLDRELGKGGTATVYLAHDVKHNRKVAVKVLRPELASILGGSRFLKEIEVTANLQHPNILPLYDSGEADSFLYYVMPFIEGETLRDRLDHEKQLGIDETVRIAQSVAAALEFAHERGLVHRDIKPENILLQAGQAIVADFGIALAIHEAGGTRLTETGFSPGTPRYMSPEQARGDSEVDSRSDIYGLAAVVYEMLVGEPPFSGNNAQAVLVRLLTEEPLPIHKMRPSVPSSTDMAIMQALAKTPADRFRTISEFAEALTPTIATTAERPGTDARNRWPAVLVTMVLGATLLALGVWMIGRGISAPIRSLAVLPLRNVSGDSAQEYFVQGIHGALITELSQLDAFDRVISQTSAMRFRDSDLTAPEIGTSLDVDALLEGSVVRVGDDIRIDVNLVQASPERTLWAHSYQANLSGILALQRQVTRDIASEIALTLTPGQQSHLAGGRQIDPEAHDLFLRGRYHWNRRSEDGLRRAVDYFNRAIAIDPTYAPAYAGLSDAYNLLGQYMHIPLDEATILASSAAERAIAFDSTLAAAFTARAEAHVLRREWAAAEQAYRHALRLNPGYATGHHFFGWFLSHMGRDDEAIAELNRASELDPLSVIISSDLAGALFNARRYDEAADQVQRTLEFEPGFPQVEWSRFLIHMVRGTVESAYPPTEPLPVFRGILQTAQLLAVLGRRAEAESIVQDVIDAAGGRGNVGAHESGFIAIVYIGLGNNDTALDWLQQAVDDGLATGAYSLAGPLFDPVRSDPRFVAIMEQMGFPE